MIKAVSGAAAEQEIDRWDERIVLLDPANGAVRGELRAPNLSPRDLDDLQFLLQHEIGRREITLVWNQPEDIIAHEGLRKAGMERRRAACRMVAFLVLTYFVYTTALVIFGVLLRSGVLPGRAPLAGTVVPAAISGGIISAPPAGASSSRHSARLKRPRRRRPAPGETGPPRRRRRGR